MKQDVVTKMLRQVASGEVSVEDARAALEGVELDESTYESAIDHGVFNRVEPGTIVRASLAKSSTSALVVLTILWGLGWTLYWAGSMMYGLFIGWNLHQLSFHLGMVMITLIIMGVLYLKWIAPDVVIVKNRRKKYAQTKDPDSWHKYDV